MSCRQPPRRASKRDGRVKGAGPGLIAWLGFVATGLAGNYVFDGRPGSLFGIVAGYQLVRLVLMNAIVGAWR